MTTSIYSVLNTKIQEILDAVDEVAVVYAYPRQGDLQEYPAAIYYPSTFENEFNTTQDNFKTYGYKLWIVCGTSGTDVQTLFNSVMPNVLDAVLEEFDDEWSFTSIAGHRVWCKIDTGGWTVSQEEGGVEVSAEIDLSVKMLTT